MKDIIVWSAILLIIASGVVLYRANKHSDETKGILEQERFLRMDAEENLLKAQRTIRSLEADLARANRKIKSVVNILKDNNDQKTSLETRVQELDQSNKDFERRIKELRALQAAASVP